MTEPFHGIGGRPSAAELARRAAAEIEAVVEAVLPDCRREGGELRGHGNDGALWVVETRGAKRGVALCASEPERSGDPLTLIAEALYGGGRREAYGWLLARYGDAAAAPEARPRQAPSCEREAANLERRRRRAFASYLDAEPIAGTPADDYLAGRGIPPEFYRRSGLRYAPASFYAPGIELPAMVAPVLDLIERRLVAVHRTYLAPRDGGGWTKTARIPARKCWAPFKGGAIPLGRGASGKRLRDAPDDDGCLIAEGIENALSAAFLRPELRVFAAVSSGNIPALVLPPTMASVLLVQDRDGENRAVAEAYARAIDRWLHEGRGVETMRPPGGHADMNAWLQATLQQTGEAA